MATILGQANLSTSFTAFSEDNRLATYNNTRATTTDYRRPVSVYDNGGNLTAPSGGTGATDLFLLDYYQARGDHQGLDYYEQPQYQEFAGSNVVGTIQRNFNFDFTDIDRNATFTSTSLQIQIDLQSQLRGYSGVLPLSPDSNGVHWGKVKASWNHTNANSLSGTNDEVVLTSGDRQTITLTLPGYDATLSHSEVSHPFGDFPQVCIEFIGTVNRNGDSTNPSPSTQASGRYGGGWNTDTNPSEAYSLRMDVYSVKARYTFTGRTYLTTGLQHRRAGGDDIINGDYNFTNLIPSNNVYKGLSVLASSINWVDHNYGGSQPRLLTFKNDTNDNLLKAITTDNKLYGPQLFVTGQPRPLTSTTRMFVNGVDYADNIDQGLINEVVPTISMFQDPDFDVVYYHNGDALALTRKQVNIAYMPLFSGEANLTTSFSIADIDADQIHGIVDSELSDIAPAFSLTALGGLRIGDATSNVSVSITTDIGDTTTGLIKGYTSSTTQSLSTAFSITNDTNNTTVAHTTGSTPSFNVNIADITPTVLLDTLVSQPISPSVNFNVSLDNNNTGLLIQVTSLKPAEPTAAVAIADLVESPTAGYQLIRSPSAERLLVRQTRTGIFLTDIHNRTLTPTAFTRTIVAQEPSIFADITFALTSTWSNTTDWTQTIDTPREINANEYTRTIDSDGLQ